MDDDNGIAIGRKPTRLRPTLQATITGILQWLKDYGDSFGAIQSIATVIALGLGGWWTWIVFVRGRKGFPRLSMTHTTEWWRIDEGSRILRVTLLLKNEGEVLVCLQKGHVWIQQISPSPAEVIKEANTERASVEIFKDEHAWPLVGERNFCFEECEVEPQETDEVTSEFVISTQINKVLVYSYFDNAAKPGRNIGWRFSSIVDFADHDEAPAAETSTGGSRGKGKIKPPMKVK